MKKILRFITVWFVITCLTFLSGCSKSESLVQYKNLKSNSTENIEVKNNDYSMIWDNDIKTIILKDNSTGATWSTVKNLNLGGEDTNNGAPRNSTIESGVLITYYDTEKFLQYTVNSSIDAQKYGKIFARKTSDNSISVMYDFSKVEISVIVEYVLDSEGIVMKVEPGKITEGENKLVTNIALSPYICSVSDAENDAYVFVPSGSGTLIYSGAKTDSLDNVVEEVYGKDLAVYEKITTTVTSKVSLPVYGCINGNKGLMAIIEEGAEGCSIISKRSAGSLQYTTVYADFSVRGYEYVEKPTSMKTAEKMAKYFSNPNDIQPISIRYSPLQGANISYVDMAEKYSSYLIDKYNLKSKTADQAISLRILGGVMGTEYYFGVPCSVLKPLTTLEQSKTMIEKFEELYDGKLIYNLDGFGNTGLDVGEIAGGYDINSRLGTKSEVSKLFKYCDEQNINLFMNFDLIRYNNSSYGFGSALAATQKRIFKNYNDLITGSNNLYDSYNLLKRSQIIKAAEKLDKFASKYDISGISVDTLSNKLYSDYSDTNYYCKSNSKEISSAIDFIAGENRKILTNNANLYAAICSDYIDGVSVQSSDYDFYDCDIPFYQMVFSGIIPMYSSNYGSASEENELMLKAIESGIGISILTAYDYSSDVFSSPHKSVFSSNFDNSLDIMEKLKNKGFFEFYDKISDSQIVEHEILTSDVRKTVFANGVEVYVNYSDTKYESPEVRIDANSYAVKEGNR